MIELPPIPKQPFLAKQLKPLWEYLRRSRIIPGPGVRYSETGTPGIYLDTAGGGPALPQRAPFELFVEGGNLLAAPGTLEFDAYGETEEEDPANGTWYLEAKFVINTTSGAITSTTIDFVQTEGTDTTSDYYTTLAEIDVTDGIPDPSSIVQYNYGPIRAFAHGTATDKWALTLY